MDKLVQDSKLSIEAENLPGSNIMGLGYNIKGDYADTDSTIGLSLFDFPDEIEVYEKGERKYSCNSIFEVNGAYEHTLYAVTGSTIENYQKDLSLSVDVAGACELFSGALNSAFDKNLLRQEETIYTTIRDVHRQWQITLPGPDIIKKYLREDVKKDLNTIEVSPTEIFNKYGAVYIGEVIIGGRIDYNTATKSLKIHKDTDVRGIARSSYEELVGSIKIKSNSKGQKEIRNFRENSESILKAVGGNAAFVNGISHSPDSENAFSAWLAGLFNYAVLMDFTKNSLIPVWELVDDETRRDELQRAFSDWLVKGSLKVAKNKHVLGLKSTFMRSVDRDAGSGAAEDLSIWAPKIHSNNGYFYGGQWGQQNYNNYADDDMKTFKDLFNLGYLKPPIGFHKIWDDAGSRNFKDYSCWRPVPPAGYRALGDIMVLGHSSRSVPENLTEGLYCVYAGLCRHVGKSDIAKKHLWDDHGTGAAHHINLWRIIPSRESEGVDMGTFIGVPAYGDVSDKFLEELKGKIGIIREEFTVDTDEQVDKPIRGTPVSPNSIMC